MKILDKNVESVLPWVLSIGLLVIYLFTMAPGLTWANDGADGGDLIAAAATGGVAHPTGYPFYLMIARVFQSIPVGSLAYRTNVLSALATVLGVLLVYSMVSIQTNWTAGLVSGLAFGLAPLVWSQAIITEVYALHSFFVALLLFVMSVPAISARQKWLDRLRGIVLGLAIGNHITTVLLIPIVFLTTLSRAEGHLDSTSSFRFHLAHTRWQVDVQALFRQLAWMGGTTILVYSTLPLRAVFHSPVNWGNPSTWSGFAWLVSGSLYQNEFLSTLPSIGLRIQSWFSSLVAQFGIIGVIVGWTGLVVFFRSSSLMRITVWIVLSCSIFAILYGSADSYVYLIPAFLCFAIWIGFGADGLMKEMDKHFQFSGKAIGLFLICYLLFLGSQTWRQVDASRDYRAEQFGESVLVQAPPHAIIFAQGDRAVFAMWYLEYALHRRPDLAVIATDLLPFDWYLETLRYTYSGLSLPGYLPWPESVIANNPRLPVCYVRYDTKAEIQCATMGGN